jgi:hypothetical protein
MGWTTRVRFPAEARDILFSTESRPTLGPTQPHIQYVPGALFPAVNLITHLHLVSRLRMVELYLHYPIYLPGMVFNYIIRYQDNFTFYFTIPERVGRDLVKPREHVGIIFRAILILSGRK